MIFTEHRFALFFAVVFALYWALRGNTTRKAFLLVCSYAFYAVWDWRFLSLIWVSTLVDYVLALAMERSEAPRRRRALLVTSLVVNLGILGVFKYLGFFLDSTADLLALLGFEVSLPVLRILLPAGISFYTFQTLSYTLDVHAGKQRAQRNLLDVALFVGFFPQLVAGPIVRSREFLPQLLQKRAWARVPVQAMLWMLLVGFFKKACVSDNIHLLVDAYWASPTSYTSLDGLLAGFYFTIQLYCDFSGYSDMAIACAGLLGYALPMNFYFPLLACDYTQLMNRWHMTLSRWVRDYLYLPLVGRSRSVGYQLLCLGITMVLVGLWHGAAWHFVVWGLGMGLGGAIHRAWKLTPLARRLRGPYLALAGFVVTYLWVTWMLIIFRAPDLGEAWYVARAWLGVARDGQMGFGNAAWGLFLALGLVHFAFYRLKPERWVAGLPDWGFAMLLGVLVPLTLAFARADVQPFIYFQF